MRLLLRTLGLGLSILAGITALIVATAAMQGPMAEQVDPADMEGLLTTLQDGEGSTACERWFEPASRTPFGVLTYNDTDGDADLLVTSPEPLDASSVQLDWENRTIHADVDAPDHRVGFLLVRNGTSEQVVAIHCLESLELALEPTGGPSFDEARAWFAPFHTLSSGEPYWDLRVDFYLWERNGFEEEGVCKKYADDEPTSGEQARVGESVRIDYVGERAGCPSAVLELEFPGVWTRR